MRTLVVLGGLAIGVLGVVGTATLVLYQLARAAEDVMAEALDVDPAADDREWSCASRSHGDLPTEADVASGRVV